MSASYPIAPETSRPLRRSSARPAGTRRDPLAAVLGLGDRAARVGGAIGLAVALLSHGTASAKALRSLTEMRASLREMRSSLHDFFWTHYDIDLDRPKPPETPTPPPPPEPEPVAPPEPKAEAPRPKDDPYDAPPAAAKAAKILTAPEPTEKVEDLTDRGIVSGDGDAPGYGMVAAAGTGTAPTFNPAAKVGGTPGGTGTGTVAPPPPPPPDVDRSKPPGIVGGTDWNCPFPPEADADQVDFAVASIVVTVRPDGTPQSVRIVNDPGHGFGRAARICALGRRFTPGLDRGGQSTTATTPPIKVRFTR